MWWAYGRVMTFNRSEHEDVPIPGGLSGPVGMAGWRGVVTIVHTVEL